MEERIAEVEALYLKAKRSLEEMRERVEREPDPKAHADGLMLLERLESQLQGSAEEIAEMHRHALIASTERDIEGL